MSSSKRRLGRMFAVTMAAGALSACVHDEHPERLARAQMLLPTEQFGIKVTSRPEQLALGVHPSGLSPTQATALAEFVSRWRDDGGGPVSVQLPGGRDLATSRPMAAQVMSTLTADGVPAPLVRMLSYVPVAPGAPVLVRYERFEALGPNCSFGWADLTTTGGNAPYDHFGCAVTANVAAQVANPRDFLAPAVVTPADASRREVVLGHYRRGETTSASKDDQANAKSSDTGSN